MKNHPVHPENRGSDIFCFEYNAAGTTYSLVQFPFSEGRVLPKGGGLYGYEYFMKDHLGNVRVSFEPADNNNITLTQEDYYYPFGLRVPIVDQAANKNRYLYNGKELESFADLNWYYFGARAYDPQIVRWPSVDPNAYKYFSWSPYSYCFNSPINCIDPDGKDIYILFAPNGANGAGHLAVIIGNATSGYRYYSKDGAKGGGVSGEAKYAERPLSNIAFSGDIEDFINGVNSERSQDGDALYKDYFKITTSEDQDKTMAGAVKVQIRQFYDVWSNSCNTTPLIALSSIGLRINPYFYLSPDSHIPRFNYLNLYTEFLNYKQYAKNSNWYWSYENGNWMLNWTREAIINP